MKVIFEPSVIPGWSFPWSFIDKTGLPPIIQEMLINPPIRKEGRRHRETRIVKGHSRPSSVHIVDNKFSLSECHPGFDVAVRRRDKFSGLG